MNTEQTSQNIFKFSKKYIIYAKKDLILMMIIKNIRTSDIIVSTLENIEELLMLFEI